jgi:hypothetical protein
MLVIMPPRPFGITENPDPAKRQYKRGKGFNSFSKEYSMHCLRAVGSRQKTQSGNHE